MRRAATVLALFVVPASLRAQQVQTAVVPQDITVGDVFHVIIQVSPVHRGTVVFPDTLELPDDLEPAGRVMLRLDTVAQGPRWTAAYPLTGWRPGRHALPPSPVRLTAGGRALAAEAMFPELVIRSVLPADTTGVQPKPARDVLGANRIWWPWLLLAALAALLALAAWLWLHRRQAAAVPLAPLTVLSAREAVLAALERARTSGALEAEDHKRFYSDVSSSLRAYVAAVHPTLGADLTTSELATALRRMAQEPVTADLQRVLRAADLVKFARRQPAADEALLEWQRAHDWVERYEPISTAARAA